MLIGSAVSLWYAPASLTNFDDLGSNEMDKTVLADPLYDYLKRKSMRLRCVLSVSPLQHFSEGSGSIIGSSTG